MTDTSNISNNPFPYTEQPKTHTLQLDSTQWRQITELPSIDEFWKRRDPGLLSDYEASMDYLQTLALTQNDIREYPEEFLQLFELMQCLLEIRDSDAEAAENLELDLQDLEAENDALRRDLDKAKADLQKANTESQGSHRQDKLHQRELEDKNSEIAEWKKRCHDKDTILSNVNADLDEAKRKLRDAEANLSQAKQKERRYKEEIHTLTAMERKMRGRNAEDDEAIRELEDQIDALKSEREALKSELEETTDQVLRYKDEAAALLKVENELRQTIKTNQNEITAKTRDAEERLITISKLREELDAATEKYERQMENIQEAFKEEVDELQQHNSSLLREIQAKDDSIARLDERFSVLQVKYEEAIQQIQSSTTAKTGLPPSNANGEAQKNSQMQSSLDSVASSDTDSARMANYEIAQDDSEEVRRLKSKVQSLKQEMQEMAESSENNVRLSSDSATQDQHQLADVREKLQKAQSTKIRLEDDVIRLQEHTRELEKELVWTKEKIKSYEDGQSGLEIAKRDIRYFKEQIVKREETIERYKKLLNLYLNNIEDLRWEIGNLYKNYDHPQDKRINVKKMREDLIENLLDALLQEERRRLAHANQEMASRNVDRLQSELDALKRTHQYSNDEYKQLERQLQQQRASHNQAEEKLRSELDNMRIRLDEAQKIINRLEKRQNNSGAAMLSEAAMSETEVSELREQYTSLRRQYEDTLNRLHSSQEENRELKQQMDSLRKEVEGGFSSANQSKQVSKLESKLQEKRQREKELTQEIRNLRQKNDALNADIGKLKSIIQEIKDRPFDLQPQNSFSANESEKIIQLQSQLQHAQRQIDTIQTQYQNDKNAHTQARKELLESRNQVMALQMQCDELSHQVELADRQNQVLRDELAKQSEEGSSSVYSGDTKGAGAQSLSRAAIRSSPLYVEAQKQIRDLMRKLDDAQDEIISLQGEVSELKQISEGQKMREDEWNKIQERLKYHEETVKHDQKMEKQQNQNLMKQVVAGYNVMISQKDRTIEKYTAQLNSLRQEVLRLKRKHEQELEDYKNMLKSQDSKLLKELRLHMQTLEDQPSAEPGPPQGMSLEDVEELMAEKNRVIDDVSEENNLLRNRISDIEYNQKEQFDNFYKMKSHLEEQIEHQEREIEQLRFELNNEKSKPPQVITQPGETKVVTKRVTAPPRKANTQPSEKLESQLNQTRNTLLQEQNKNQHLRQSIENLTKNLVDTQAALDKKNIFDEQDHETEIEKLVNKRTAQWRRAAKELKSQAGHLSNALDRKQKVLEALQEKYVEAQREIAAKEQVLTRHNETIRRLNRTQKRLQKEVDSYRKGTMGGTDVETQEKMEDMEKRLRVLQQRQGADASTIKKEADDIRMQYKHDHEELIQQRKINDQTEERIRNMERAHQREKQKNLKKIATLDEERQLALDQRDEATLAVSQLKQKVKRIQSTHEQQLRELNMRYKRNHGAGGPNYTQAERPSTASAASPARDTAKQQSSAADDTAAATEKVLEAHRKEFQQMKDRYENETHRLNTDLNRLKNLVKQKDIKLQQLQSQNTSLADAQQVSFRTSHASEVEELRQKLSNYYSLKEELQSHLNKAARERDQHALEIKHLQEQYLKQGAESPSNQRSALDSDELLQKQRENLDLRFEKEELKQRLTTMEAKMKDLELIQAVQQEIVQVDPSASMTASRVISGANDRGAQDKKDSSSKNARHQELEKVIEAMKSVICKLQEDNEKFKKSAISNQEYMSLMNKQKALKSRLSAKKKELEKLQKEHEHQEDAREKLTKTLDQNVQLNKRLKREKEITAKHKKKQQSLQAEKEKLEQELQKIREHMTQSHNAALARQKMLHEQKVHDLVEQKQKMKTKYEHWQNRVRELEKETEKYEFKMNDLQHKFDEERLHTQEKIHELEEQLEREKQRAASSQPDSAREEAEHENSGDGENISMRQHQKEIEYYQQQMINLKEENNELLGKLRAQDSHSAVGGDDGKHLKRIRELETEREHLLQENKEQKEELDQFDESFFEELEDLKYKYMEERRMNEEYRRQLKELGVDVKDD